MSAAIWSWFVTLAVAAGEIYHATGAESLRRLYQTFVAHENELTDRQLAQLLTERVHLEGAPKR